MYGLTAFFSIFASRGQNSLEPHFARPAQDKLPCLGLMFDQPPTVVG